MQIAQNASQFASPIQLPQPQNAYQPGSLLPLVPVVPPSQIAPGTEQQQQQQTQSIGQIGSGQLVTAAQVEQDRVYFFPSSSSRTFGQHQQPRQNSVEPDVRPVWSGAAQYYNPNQSESYHGQYQSQSAPPPVRAHSQQHNSFPNEFDTQYPGYPQPSHSSMSNYPESHHYQRRRLASYPMHEPPHHLYHAQQHPSHHRPFTPFLSQHTEEDELGSHLLPHTDRIAPEHSSYDQMMPYDPSTELHNRPPNNLVDHHSAEQYSNHTAPMQPAAVQPYPSHSSTFPSNGGKRNYGPVAQHQYQQQQQPHHRPRIMAASLMTNNDVYCFDEGTMGGGSTSGGGGTYPNRTRHSAMAGGHPRSISHSEPPPRCHQQQPSQMYQQQQTHQFARPPDGCQETSLSSNVMPSQTVQQVGESTPYSSSHVRLSYEDKKLL